MLEGVLVASHTTVIFWCGWALLPIQSRGNSRLQITYIFCLSLHLLQLPFYWTLGEPVRGNVLNQIGNFLSNASALNTVYLIFSLALFLCVAFGLQRKNTLELNYSQRQPLLAQGVRFLLLSALCLTLQVQYLGQRNSDTSHASSTTSMHASAPLATLSESLFFFAFPRSPADDCVLFCERNHYRSFIEGLVSSVPIYTFESRLPAEQYLVAHKNVAKEESFPHVVFVLLESIPYSRTSLADHHRDTTPFLKSLVPSSLNLKSCYSIANESRNGQTSLLSNTLPMRGFFNSFGDFDFPRYMIWEVMGALGYETAHISGQNEEWMDIRDFQTKAQTPPDYFIHGPEMEGHSYPGFSPNKKDGETVNRYAQHWLEKRKNVDKPFFLLLNYQRTHFPYPLPPHIQPTWGDGTPMGSYRAFEAKDVEPAQNQFDDALRYVDEQIKALHEIVQAHVGERKLKMIFVADHGQEFFTGLQPVAARLWENYIHTLCMIYSSDGALSQTISDPVSNLDLMPTFLGHLGLPPFPGWEGNDLIRMSPEERKRQAVYSANLYWKRQWLIIQHSKKVLIDLDNQLVTVYDGSDKNLENPLQPTVLTSLPSNPVNGFVQQLMGHYQYYSAPKNYSDYLYKVAKPKTNLK